MINKRYLLATILISVVQAATDSSKNVSPARDSRFCMSNQIGMDYVEASVNKIFEQYIKRWNDHEAFPSIQKINHAGNTQFISKLGGQHFTVEAEQKGVDVKYDYDKDKKKIEFSLPILAKSFTKISDDMHGVTFKDTLTLSVDIRPHEQWEKQHVPQWRLNLKHDVHSFLCKLEQKACNILLIQLEDTFASKFMDFHSGEFFDQPSALRQMYGLMQNTNYYAEHTAMSSHFSINRDNLYVMLNCQAEEVRKVLRKKVRRNIFELGLSQNLLDAVNLESFQIDMDRAVKFALRKFGAAEDVQRSINNFGLTNIKNQMGPVQDNSVIQRIKYSKLQKPGVTRTTDAERWDAFSMKKLERYNVKQNLYLQIYDKKEKSDITILPFEVEAEFWLAIIDSYKLKFGTTQQLNFRDLEVNVVMADCQSFKNPIEFDPNEPEIIDDFELEVKEKADEVEDDEDFEEEEAEENDEEENGEKAEKAPEKKKNTMSKLAQLACGLKPKINQLLRDKVVALIRQGIHEFKTKSRGARNEWMAIEFDLGYQFQHLCSGIQIQQPLLRMDENRLVYSAELNASPLNIDAFCDNEDQELFDQDPRIILQNNGTQIANLLRENDQAQKKKNLMFQWTIPGMLTEWIGDSNEYVVNEKLYSPIFKSISTYQPLKAFCKKQYPEYDEQMCANTFNFFKGHQSYDAFLGEEIEVYGDYSDREEAQKPGHQLRAASRAILYVGLLMYMLRITLPVVLMKGIVFFGTFALTWPMLDMPFYRYCPDYTAYITQASQFSFGQTAYLDISASQGNIFYPAFHLWHYLANYHLHLETQDAEYYLKMGHILMHATVQLCIASIAYKYFFRHTGSAQMVCFMMLSNDQLRRMYQFLYNDCLMTFYLVLCLYFFSKKMIWLSAAAFSFALGIKTGALAVVPAFLGCVQWQYGTMPLLTVVSVILLLQVLPPLPICGPDWIAHLLGWKWGANTTLKQYLSQSTLVPGAKDDGGHNYKARAAGRQFSVFWKFLSVADYNKWILTEHMMKVILALNVYYFFLRRCMLTGCIERLSDSLKCITNSTVTLGERTKCIEIILILYVSACQFMPGGHENFQVWFVDMIPIIMVMTNLHPIFFFKLYMDVYPGTLYQSDVLHHLLSLGLCGLLLVFKGGIEKCTLPKFAAWRKKDNNQKVKEE